MSTLTSMLKNNTAVKAPETEQGTDKAEDKSTHSATIANVRADAALFASQLGEEIVDLIVETADASESVKRNPLLIMFKLEDRFDGKDGRKKLDDCPVPGSKTGNNPDHVEDKEKNAAGELKAVKTSFWREVAMNLEEGKAIKTALADVNGKTGRWIVDGQDGSPTEWRRVQEKKRLDGRLGNLATIVRKAAALHFQCSDIQALPGVELEFGTDVVDGEVILANVTSPITVCDKNKRGVFETMTVGQFLQLDPTEAAVNGGTYSALIKTLGREGNNGQGDTGNKVKAIKSIDDLLSILDEVYVYLDQDTDEGKKHAAALAKHMANPKTGDDAVLSVCNAAEVLDAPSTRARDRFIDLQNAVTAARQSKAS